MMAVSYTHLDVYKRQAQNTGAIGFYQQMGFQVVTEQPNEDSGLPELLMAWQREN